MIEKRFWDKVNVGKIDKCWNWKIGTGRARYYVDGKAWTASRFLMENILKRKLLKEELVCHHCDNPKCVNPKHLYVGSQKENVRDMYERGRQSINLPGCDKKYSGVRYITGRLSAMRQISNDMAIDQAIELLDEGYTPHEIAFKTGLDESLFKEWV